MHGNLRDLEKRGRHACRYNSFIALAKLPFGDPSQTCILVLQAPACGVAPFRLLVWELKLLLWSLEPMTLGQIFGTVSNAEAYREGCYRRRALQLHHFTTRRALLQSLCHLVPAFLAPAAKWGPITICELISQNVRDSPTSHEPSAQLVVRFARSILFIALSGSRNKQKQSEK